MNKWRFGLVILVITGSSVSRGELHDGFGGSFFEYHGRNLSSFDNSVSGNPLTIGGMGCSYFWENVCFGGAAGGTVATQSSGNLGFAMGYGGVLLDYAVTDWLSARVVAGVGAFRIDKILSDSPTERHLQFISKSSFFILKPGIFAHLPMTSWMLVSVGVSAFVPTVSELMGATVGMNLIFGT